MRLSGNKMKCGGSLSYTCECGFIVAVGEEECMNCKTPREVNDEIRNAFQEYIESDDYKDNIELNKVFDNPQGALWCAFIAGWEARKEKYNEG